MDATKILIVDDDISVRNVLKDILASNGYIVVTVENGSQAYQQFKMFTFDLILLDINMPKMDGVETVKAIRERSPHVPIIIISGYSGAETISEAIEFGANDFIRKPCTPEQLLAVCAQWSGTR